MKQLPSHDFRKTYARLSEPVEVTSNGHVIGTYIPGPRSTAALFTNETSVAPLVEESRIAVMSQKERDRILRRVSKSS